MFETIVLVVVAVVLAAVVVTPRYLRKRNLHIAIWTEYADFWAKVLTSVAIIAGGSWTLYLTGITSVFESNIELSITTEVLPYTDSLRLLVVHVRPKNVGKVTVEIGGRRAGKFRVSVKSLPENTVAGQWIAAESTPMLTEVDILRHHPDGYAIEPAGGYDEVEALPVRDGTYLVEARFETVSADYFNVYHVVRVTGPGAR